MFKCLCKILYFRHLEICTLLTISPTFILPSAITRLLISLLISEELISTGRTANIEITFKAFQSDREITIKFMELLVSLVDEIWGEILYEMLLIENILVIHQ